MKVYQQSPPNILHSFQVKETDHAANTMEGRKGVIEMVPEIVLCNSNQAAITKTYQQYSSNTAHASFNLPKRGELKLP